MVRVKICGITNPEDARLAAELGAHALGLIFYPKSPRSIKPEAARDIIKNLPPLVLSVGVFVDEEAELVRGVAATVGLDWVQLHGQESPEYCRSLMRRVIKGFRVQDESSLAVFANVLPGYLPQKSRSRNAKIAATARLIPPQKKKGKNPSMNRISCISMPLFICILLAGLRKGNAVQRCQSYCNSPLMFAMWCIRIQLIF